MAKGGSLVPKKKNTHTTQRHNVVRQQVEMGEEATPDAALGVHVDTSLLKEDAKEGAAEKRDGDASFVDGGEGASESPSKTKEGDGVTSDVPASTADAAAPVYVYVEQGRSTDLLDSDQSLDAAAVDDTASGGVAGNYSATSDSSTPVANVKHGESRAARGFPRSLAASEVITPTYGVEDSTITSIAPSFAANALVTTESPLALPIAHSSVCETGEVSKSVTAAHSYAQEKQREKPGVTSGKKSQSSTSVGSECGLLKRRKRDFVIIMSATAILLAIVVITILTFVTLFLVANIAVRGIGVFMVPSVALAAFTVGAAVCVGYFIYRAANPNIGKEVYSSVSCDKTDAAKTAAEASPAVGSSKAAGNAEQCASKCQKQKEARQSCHPVAVAADDVAAQSSAKEAVASPANAPQNRTSATSEESGKAALCGKDTTYSSPQLPSVTLTEAFAEAEAKEAAHEQLVS